MNAALRMMVRSEQHAHAQVALKDEASSGGSTRDPGVFKTSTTSRLISANTIVVSALVQVDEQFPGGHAAGFWMSSTVRVPSGSPVHLVDLLARPALGLHALAAAVRKQIMSSSSCAGGALRYEQRHPGYSNYALRYSANAKNYRFFALTANGLAVGFPVGQVAPQMCYEVEEIVPYATLRPFWSMLAKKLIAGVRGH